jgi:hypothetical protein
MEPDEGIILQGAQRILRGQVLYRDFFSFLTPGSFYLHALLFRIFGNGFLVPRTALAVAGGLFSSVGYILARRVCSRSSALLGAGLLTLTTLPYRFLTLHNWDSTLLALLALFSAVRLIETNCGAWALTLGSLTALTILFEQSKGVALAIGLVFGFGAVALANLHKVNRAHLAWLVAGLTWPFLITLAYFISQHALSAMLADWLWPLQHYSAANRVRYGYSSWSEDTRQMVWESGSWPMRLFKLFVISPIFFVPVLPLLAIVLFVWWGLRSIRKEADPAKSAHYCVVTGVLAGLLISIVAVRADIVHFMYLQPLYGLLLTWIFDGRDIPGRLFRAAHPILSGLLVVAFLLFAAPLLLRVLNAPHKLETRRGVVMTPAADSVLPFTLAHVEPGATLLVYPYLPLYNYFTATVSPVPYDYFQPGMNTSEQADAILEELKSGGATAVLFEPQFALKIPSSWPGTPEDAILRDPVADYIAAHYRVCAIRKSPEEWRFWYMVRGDLACP